MIMEPQQPSQKQQTYESQKYDSQWITDYWKTFQEILGRAVVWTLFLTMLYSIAIVIPGFGSPPQQVTAVVFLIQFLSLDIGGLGLFTLAKRLGKGLLSWPRIISYLLILLTIVSVAFSGYKSHATIDTNTANTIELWFVITRCVFTIIYLFVIHTLDDDEKSFREQIKDLAQQCAQLPEFLRTAKVRDQQIDHLNSVITDQRNVITDQQKEIDHLQQLNSVITDQQTNNQSHVNSLTVQLDMQQEIIDRLQNEAHAMRQESERDHSLITEQRDQLNVITEQRDQLRDQLNTQSDHLNRVITDHETVNTDQQNVISEHEHLITDQQKLLAKKEQEVLTLQKKVESLEAVIERHEQKIAQHKGTLRRRDQSKTQRSDARVIPMRSMKKTSEQTEHLRAAREALQADPTLSGRGLAKKIGVAPATGTRLLQQVQKDQHDDLALP